MASDSSDLLLTRLRELRRRATRVLFVQALCFSGCVSVLIGEALVVGGAAHNVIGAIAVAATAALLTAAVVTIALRPGLRDIAASIDAHLHLQDRLVTALQFSAAADPFSKLVVRDAHSRVTGVRASDALPFALPRGIRAAAATAATVSAVMIVATVGVPRWAPAGWSGFGSPDVAASATGASARASSAASQQVNPATRSAIPADDGTERSSARQQPAADQTTAATRSPQARSLSEIASRSSGSTDRLDGGSTTNGSATSTNSGTDTPDDAGAASGAASTTQEKGSGGGVANGARTARSTGTTPPRLDSTYRAAYQRSRAMAESAIAGERVPADLRSYVLEYFVAIRPAGDK